VVSYPNLPETEKAPQLSTDSELPEATQGGECDRAVLQRAAHSQGGRASYLEVLTNETNYFNAELGLAQARLNELLALVELYRNFGGGWQS